MELWWSRAERLRWELEQLSLLGFRYDPPGDLESTDACTLRVYAPWRGEEVALDVTFPQLYPYFRCEVVAEGLELPRHQHPFEKNLCLLGRGTHLWEPKVSLAWLLSQQLPKLAAALDADSRSSAAALEEAQAEPVSDYYPYRVGDVVLVDSSWRIPPEFDRGHVELGYTKPHGDDDPFRAVVREITRPDGTTLFRAPDHLLGLFPNTLAAELLRLDAPLLIGDAEQFQRELRRSSRPPRWEGHARSQRCVLGVVFPEEQSWRGSEGSGQGWLFVIGAKAKHAHKAQYRFVRADRAGVADLRRHHRISLTFQGAGAYSCFMQQMDTLTLKILGTLNEAQARWYVAREALARGRGGLKAMHELTGMSRPTILKGVRELQAGKQLTVERVRKPGGGRKPIEEADPGFARALEGIMVENTAGDPMSLLRWTNKSTSRIAEELTRLGHPTSDETVRRKLVEMGYSLQANRKSLEGSSSTERDEQFRYINRLVKRFLREGNPVLSVDTKKKERVGNFKNAGQTWRRRGEPAEVNIYGSGHSLRGLRRGSQPGLRECRHQP